MLSIFNALVHVQAGMQFCVYLMMSEIHCAVTFVSRLSEISIYSRYWCVLASVVRPLLVSSSNTVTASTLTVFL